jgi:hypothetical protein
MSIDSFKNISQNSYRNISVFNMFLLAFGLSNVFIISMIFKTYSLPFKVKIIYAGVLFLTTIIGCVALLTDGTIKKYKLFYFVGFSFWVALCLYTDVSILDGMKFIAIILFYLGIGWYPSQKWIGAKYGATVTIGMAIIIGNLILNTITTSLFLVLGPSLGSLVTFLSALLIIIFGFINSPPIKRFLFTRNDTQVLGVIVLVILMNFLFMAKTYPQGSTAVYSNYVKSAVYYDIFPDHYISPYGVLKRHYSCQSIPALWTKLLKIDISAIQYFELTIGISGFLLLVYVLSRYIFVDKHNYGLSSMVFVAFLGSAMFYSYLMTNLTKGEDISAIMFNFGGERVQFHIDENKPLMTRPIRSHPEIDGTFITSLLPAHNTPFSIQNYLDNAKSYCIAFLMLYVILKSYKTRIALLFTGASLFIIASGAEQVLLGFSLITGIVLLSKGKDLLKNIKHYKWLFIGIAIGMVFWVLISSDGGGLLAVKEKGILIRDWKWFGLCNAYPNEYSLTISNFSSKTLKYAIEWLAFIILFAVGSFLITKNPITSSIRKIVLVSLIVLSSIPVFFALSPNVYVTATKVMNQSCYDLNRFIGPLLYWLYIIAGVGFMGYLDRFNIKFHHKYILGTFAIFISISPIILYIHRFFLAHLARTYNFIN